MDIPTAQYNKINAILCDLHEIDRAKIVNAIEQAYDQHAKSHDDFVATPAALRWTTARIKALPEWSKIADFPKKALSDYMDFFLFTAQGNDGCVTEKGVKSYYKADYTNTTHILPTKLML